VRVADVVDIGCGKQKQPGAVGVDIRDYDAVDVQTDIEAGLPFESGTFAKARANSVLEHVENLSGVMAEIHRVLEPGGRLVGKVPHHGDRNAYIDPTHARLFDERTFDFWDSTTEFGDREYFDAEFRVRRAARIKRVLFWRSRPIRFDLEAVK